MRLFNNRHQKLYSKTLFSCRQKKTKRKCQTEFLNNNFSLILPSNIIGYYLQPPIFLSQKMSVSKFQHNFYFIKNITLKYTLQILLKITELIIYVNFNLYTYLFINIIWLWRFFFGIQFTCFSVTHVRNTAESFKDLHT